MRPTLEPGDWALAVRVRRVRRGDVVVVEHPERSGFELVKRVVHVPGDVTPDGLELVDEIWIEGDEPEGSSDSRRFGPVPVERVRARVRWVWWPPSALGRSDACPCLIPTGLTPGRLRYFPSCR